LNFKKRSPFSDFSDDDCISETIMKEAPNDRDLKNIRRILSDFGLKNLKIPNCKTRFELQHWLREVVGEKFKDKEEKKKS